MRFHSYVIGTRTCETLPGLNRHLRNVSVVTLSRIALPVLCAIIALVTLPLAVSTIIAQTPLPVIFACFAWYGYSGKGALTARAWAADKDSEVGVDKLATWDCAAEADRFFTRVLFFTRATGDAGSSAAAVGSGTIDGL